MSRDRRREVRELIYVKQTLCELAELLFYVAIIGGAYYWGVGL